MKVCLDERAHGTQSLAYARLAQFQGPSLLVYNDSVFRESDFASISSVGDSAKREQVGKTGRFGVGFNAVYHLTDVPSFVSGRHAVFFDPHATHLPNVSSANPGKRVDFVNNDVLGKHRDQFAPFLAFGCDARSEFAGTTFRFPLRTEAQAARSKLSKASYALEDVRSLLRDFAKEAVLDMLFLKTVAAVEISEWRVGDDAPTTRFVARTPSPSAALVSARGAFARASAAHAEKGAHARIEPETASRFDVTFATSEWGAEDETRAARSGARTFVVAQALGAGPLRSLVATGREKFGMRLVPWAAVAAELDHETANGADDSKASREPSGRAFCFLPLPVMTGLPVHVNAFFELSSNRRDVWHGGDMSGGGAARSEWNQALLEKVVSPSYVTLLLAIKAKVDRGEVPLRAYYALFPSGDSVVQKPWDAVVRETCASLSRERVLHTPACGGAWITPEEATFPDHQVERDRALRDALIEEGVPIPDAPAGILSRLEAHAAVSRRASPNGARRILKQNDRCFTRPRSRVLTLLRYCLSDVADDDAESTAALADVPLVPLADGTCGAFERASEDVFGGAAEETVTRKGEERGKKRVVYFVPTVEEAAWLFRGARDVCVDVFAADAGEASSDDVSASDDAATRSTPATLGEKKAPERPPGRKRETLDPELTRRFEALADARSLNLRRVDDAATLASLMPRVLPAVWKCSDADMRAGVVADAPPVPWRPRGAGPGDGATRESDEGHPSAETLAFLWRKLGEVCPDAADLALFRGWPLLPVADIKAADTNAEGASRRLAPLGAAVVAAAEGAPSLSRRAVAALEEAGVRAMTPSGFADSADCADSAANAPPGGEGEEDSGRRLTFDGTEGTEGAFRSACPATIAARALLFQSRDESFARAMGCFAASGAGVADALAAAFAAKTARNGGAYAPFEFSARAAQALRSYLLQRRWFGARARLGRGGDAGAPARLATIKGLRIYEAYPDPDPDSDPDDPNPEKTPSKNKTTPILTSLDGDVPPCLPPSGPEPDPALLGAGFLRVADPEEARALETCLGVARVSPAAFLRTRVLARLDVLPARALDAAMLAALRSLGSLTHGDENMPAALARAPFVATASGKRVAPKSLYDPRVPELAALLAASADAVFPAAPFDDPRVLETLAGLGMRAGVTRAAVLEAALAAERMQSTDAAAAKRQGLAVLRYLETPEGAALLSPDPTPRAVSAKSLFGSLFGSSGRASSGSGPNASDPDAAASDAALATAAPGSATTEATTESVPSEKLDHRAFVARLARVAWAPIKASSAGADAPPAFVEDVEERPGVDGKRDGIHGDVSASPAKSSVRSFPVCLAAPAACRPPSDAWLCSASKRALEEEPRSSAVADAFGWRAPLSAATLAKQLRAFGDAHASVRGEAAGRALAAAVPRVYAALTSMLGTEAFEEAARDVLEGSRSAGSDARAGDEASGNRVVWVGVGFAKAREVAFHGALHLTPYLHVLPADLLAFKPLLTRLGVRERFEADDYVALLRRLKRDAGTEQPLTARRLDVALWVLGSVADARNEREAKRTPSSVTTNAERRAERTPDVCLPVPDENGVLVDASALRFNDAPWISPPSGTRLCHPKLPGSTAAAAGVASLRLSLLHEASEDIGLSLHGSAEAEAFGQSEALTTRLRHILDAYADGPGVISELVQNADDAGATEVRLLLDARGEDELGARSLLSPKMRTWQGPALVCWNDATFSESDFRNIARIGQDSKVAKPAAAGRFGLGFNAVYHFTDLPSFVSGSHLVAFDPHAAFLPGASAAKPGLKIAFARDGGETSGLLAQFPDQFAGYRGIFGCDFRGAYDGTLFRFPLRSPEAAKTSEIKAEAYTEATVRDLFAAFKKNAAHTLLFLKNVTKIGVYEMSSAQPDSPEVESARGEGGAPPKNSPKSPRLLYEARVPAFQDGKDPRKAVAAWVETERGGATPTRGGFRDKLRAASEASLPAVTGWMDLDFQDFQEGSVVDTQRWLLSCALAGGAAREMALSETGEARGLVPWVGAAARVPRVAREPAGGAKDFQSANGETKDIEDVEDVEDVGSFAVAGRAFCFLPLPVLTSLPVHVHAGFELSSNRRDVWHGEDASGGGRERGAWNETVLRDAVAPAYARLLLAAAVSLRRESRSAYYALFPGAEGEDGSHGDTRAGDVASRRRVEEPWSLILAPLYASLAREPCVEATDPSASAGVGEDARVESTGGGSRAKEKTKTEWIAPRAGVFPDVTSEALRASFAPGGDLARAFAARGEWVIHSVPRGVIQAFATHAPGAARVATPRLARDLARAEMVSKHPSRNGDPRDPRLALAWLSYCLSDLDFGDATGAAALRDAPLLPLADGSLGSFRFGDAIREKDVLFVPSDEAEARLLTEMGSRKNAKPALARLVDRSAFAENDALPLYDEVLAFAKGAIGKASNVKPITSVGLASLLPDLLPDAWGVAVADPVETAGDDARARVVGCGAAVAWFPERSEKKETGDDREKNARRDHPPPDALAELWRLFVSLSPDTLAPFEGWPLLPVDGGERVAPLTPHGALVRGEGWSEHAASAVRALGVSRLHECAAASVAATHKSISLYARPASAAGVLDSAVARAAATPEAARAARAFKVADAPPESAPELRWRAAASVVPAAFERRLASSRPSRSSRAGDTTDTTDAASPVASRTSPVVDGVSARRALRAFLLQTRWFAQDAPGGAVEGARLDLFRALPVFETADGGFAEGGLGFRALAGGSPARALFVGPGPFVPDPETDESAYPLEALVLPPPRTLWTESRSRARFCVWTPRATPRFWKRSVSRDASGSPTRWWSTCCPGCRTGASRSRSPDRSWTPA